MLFILQVEGHLEFVVIGIVALADDLHLGFPGYIAAAGGYFYLRDANFFITNRTFGFVRDRAAIVLEHDHVTIGQVDGKFFGL
jgi:hypothetical protein